MNSPNPHAPGFVAGAAGAAFWLIGMVFLAVRGVEWRWLPTGARILGSWLIAVGLLLGGATLVPRRALDAGPVQQFPAEDPSGRPAGTDRDIPKFKPTRPSFLPPGFDGAQQP